MLRWQTSITHPQESLMKAQQASRTAQYMALFRALETARRPSQRLFSDPYATRFLSGSLRVTAGLATLGLVRPLCWLVDQSWPHARSSGVVRTRLIDDMVADALAAGAQQLVLLGAGFDSRPYRLAETAAVAVFEVDHPATQQAKRARLGSALRAREWPVHFVAVDFETDDLAFALLAAGFDPQRRSIVLWEGVLSYLTAESVDRTIRILATLCASRSQLVFTYWHRGALDGSLRSAEATRWMARVRSSGEPFTFGFSPDELPAYLQQRGFTLTKELSTATVARAYSPALGRRELGSELYRVALAER
jgi:methyltransferase (TIGR00027 family)